MVHSIRVLPSLALLANLVQGARVHFDLDLTWKVGAPNGQERQMIFVNGQFPGPPMVLDQGDDVTVSVTNHLPFNTSIHFHGIEYDSHHLVESLYERISTDKRIYHFQTEKHGMVRRSAWPDSVGHRTRKYIYLSMACL